jgi:acyl-homoserine-lactone acylase
VAGEDSEGASVALLTWRPMAGPKGGAGPKTTSVVRVAFRAAVDYLEQHFGGVHVKLGELQRLRRGKVDLPLGGAPDVINGIFARDEGGRLVGYQGDSYVLEVEFSDAGASSRSIHQYGASSRPESKHYADQAPLFVRHELKPTLRRESELKGALEREYRPGEEGR